MLLQTVVSVFWLCTFVALWIVLSATHGLPLRASVYRGCPCRDPPMCLDAQGGIMAKRQPFLWLLECVVLSISLGGPNKVNVIAPFCSRTCFVFDNSSWFTAIEMLQYSHSCSTSSAVLRALRRSNCFGWLCVLFNDILRPKKSSTNMLFISFEISPHLSCLLPAVSLSILLTPMLIRSLSRDCSAWNVIRNCCGWTCGWNCCCAVCCAWETVASIPVVRTATTISFCKNGAICTGRLRSDAMSELMLSSSAVSFSMFAVIVPSWCPYHLLAPAGHLRRFLDASGLAAAFLCEMFRIALLWCFLYLRLVHFILVSVLLFLWTVRFTCFMIIIIVSLSLLDLFCLSLVASFLDSSSSLSSSSS